MPDHERGPRRSQPVLVWGLATLHASLLVGLLVIVLYRAGGLGDALAGLGTALGLAVYAALWLVSWWVTGRALRGLDWPTLNRPFASPTLFVRGLAWGAVGGVVFLLLLALTIPVLRLQAGADLDVLSVPIGLAFFVLPALPFAIVLGGLVGLVFAVVDSATLAFAQWICPAPPEK